MGRHIAVREALWNSVEGLTDSQLRKTNADGWSILHVLEHLHLVETRVAGAIIDAVKSPPMEDLRTHESLKEGLLDRSHKIETPEIFRPRGVVATLQEARERLSSSRARLEAAVVVARNAGALHSHGFAHSLLGPMSIQQWYDFVPLHELRHVAQIAEIEAAP